MKTKLLRLKYVIAACVVALTIGQAKADIFQSFNLIGTIFDSGFGSRPFLGIMTIDVTTNQITSASLNVSALGTYVMPHSFEPGPFSGPNVSMLSTRLNHGAKNCSVGITSVSAALNGSSRTGLFRVLQL